MTGRNRANDQAKSAANSAIETALAGQEQISSFFGENAAGFLEGAPQNVGEVLEGIIQLTGQAPSETMASYYDRFYRTMDDIKKTGNRQLKRDNPDDIISSRSAKAFRRDVDRELDQYTNRLAGATTLASSRLRETPALTEAAFTRTEKNPAFNTLRDQNFKEAVQNPWVDSKLSSDAVSSYKRMWTYNV